MRADSTSTASTPRSHDTASSQSHSASSIEAYQAAEAALVSDSWRRAICLYTLAHDSEPYSWEPLLARARAYAAIGLWYVRVTVSSTYDG